MPRNFKPNQIEALERLAREGTGGEAVKARTVLARRGMPVSGATTSVSPMTRPLSGGGGPPVIPPRRSNYQCFWRQFTGTKR